jgi:hypothetical protein
VEAGTREDALPSDAAGLALKFAGQASRLNEIDPYYWFEFTIVGESVTVTAHPLARGNLVAEIAVKRARNGGGGR